MEKAQAKTYQNIKNRLFFFGLAIDIIVLIVFFFGGYSVFIRNYASNVSHSSFLVIGIYYSIFCLIIYVIHFPLSFFLGFTLEHKFHLSTQKFHQWLGDNLKKSALGFAITLILVEVIYSLLGRFPQHWWIGAGAFWLFFSFVLAKITPNIIIPLFFKYLPIDNEELRDRIFQLFKSCQVPLRDIYSINFSSKTKKANAFFCGIGKSKRVVLSDTLISEFSIQEIEAVVAHELGHYIHKDVIKMLFINAVLIFFGLFLMNKFLMYALTHLGLIRIDDIAFFPIILLGFIAFSLGTTPLLNAYSRSIERDADQFSIEKTKNTNAFITMMEKLGEMNLAEFHPNRFVEIFFYDHPPISKRIKFAKNLKQGSTYSKNGQ